MLTLAAADLHGNLQMHQWLVRVVVQLPPALALAGDLLGAPKSCETAERDQQSAGPPSPYRLLDKLDGGGRSEI